MLLAVVAQTPIALAQIAGQPTTGGVPVGYANGPTIVPSNSGGTVDFDAAFVNKPTEVKYRSAAGSITAQSNGPTSVDVQNIEGQYTKTSDISTNGNALTMNPDDKPAATVDGSVTALEWQQPAQVAVGDNTVDFRYAATGGGNITLNQLPSAGTVAAVTTTGQPLGQVSGTTTTFDAPATGGSLVGVKFFTPASPTIDATQAAPNASTGILRDTPVTLSVPVDDPDFAGYGDTLTVEFYVDGDKRVTKTVGSAQTVSAQIQSITGGRHSWSVEVTDGYGNTIQSDEFALKIPAELSIRSEQNPDTILQTATNATVRFFGNDRTITRTTSSGNVSFDGLPANQRFVARVDVDGRAERTVVVPSLLEQQDVYLLDENTTSVSVRFRLDDATGTFSETSVVVIERPLTFGNETRYERIIADEVGVNGITVTLEKGVRYQLRVRNQQGDNSQLGKFDARLNETVVLQPSVAAVDGAETNQAEYAYEVEYNPDAPAVSVEYADPQAQTDALTVGIEYRNGTAIRAAQTYQNASSLSLSEPLQSELEQPAFVTISGTRAGEQINIREPIGPQQQFITPSTLSPVWVQIGAGALILLVGGVFSVLNAAVGALITSLFAGVLWFLGIMSGIASGGAVALAVGLSTLNLLLTR